MSSFDGLLAQSDTCAASGTKDNDSKGGLLRALDHLNIEAIS